MLPVAAWIDAACCLPERTSKKRSYPLSVPIPSVRESGENAIAVA
jgi:hypothetical protein